MMSVMNTVMKNSKWWRRRTILERCFILVSALVFVLPTNQTAAGFENIYMRDRNPKAIKDRISVDTAINVPVSKPKDLCFTKECKSTASEVLSKIKKEVKPCDDFYQFACGNYIDTTEIPDDKMAVSTFSVVSNKLQQQLRNILREKRSQTDPKYLKLPYDFYKACMNKTLIEARNISPIQQIVNSLGGWPVIVGDSWDTKNTWTYQKAVKELNSLGFTTNYVLSLATAIDFKNSTKRILQLDQPLLGLSQKYLIEGFSKSSVSAYYNYIVDIAVLFGAERKLAEKELRESLQFEINLAKISLSKEKRRSPNDLYNLRTVKELQKLYPSINWCDYINAPLPKGFAVDENEVINVVAPSFFFELDKLLQRTDKRVVANYIMYRIHINAVKYLPKAFRKRKLQYDNISSGTKKEKPRWKECVQTVSSSRLSYSVGSMYVKKHFKEESKSTALKMVNGLSAAFSQILDEVDWMDPKTRHEAKRKLNAIITHIGYADELLDDNKLEEFYRKLEIDPNKYFESHLNMNIFAMHYSFSRLRSPVIKTDWITRPHPHVVNAFYSPVENSIHFPAAVLQGHFFNNKRPKYMNYGAIGSGIGHEITHGFDDEGQQFDLDGNLVDWWQPDTKKAFLEKTKCIIEQYGNYTNKQTGLNLNGRLTQGENIADNGGLKMSYLAYKQWVTENGEELRLPGLDYTPKQMFWIAFAQTWCAKYRTEYLSRMITTGEHSSKEFRVLGTLRNNKDFSNDFQCLPDTPMNPVHKCEIW